MTAVKLIALDVVLIIIFSILALWKNILLYIWNMFFRRQSSGPLRTPEERFSSIPNYPFSPHYLEIEGYRVHYIDEGPPKAGKTVVCLHGEPTWSFLYRKLVQPLVNAGHRVIAPDFVGFGKSDKPSDEADFTHELHMRTVKDLFEALDLTDVTLVVHDWGGITGLSALESISERVTRLVILNTGIPPSGGSHMSVVSKLNFLAWQRSAAFFGSWLPIGRLMSLAVPGLPSHIVEGYTAPFPDSQYKIGPAKWPLMVPLSQSDHVAMYTKPARDFLSHWKKPTLVMFSDKDPLLRDLAPFFKKLIPGAKDVPAIVIHGARHFVTEDKGEEVAQHIVQFLQR